MYLKFSIEYSLCKYYCDIPAAKVNLSSNKQPTGRDDAQLAFGGFYLAPFPSYG